MEMAIALPMLLLIVCGIIEFGWLFSNQLMIDNSSREGARYAITVAGNSNAVQLITQHVLDSLPENVENHVSVDVHIRTSGETQVEVTRTLTALTPIGEILYTGGTHNLISSTTMLAG